MFKAAWNYHEFCGRVLASMEMSWGYIFKDHASTCTRIPYAHHILSHEIHCYFASETFLRQGSITIRTITLLSTITARGCTVTWFLGCIITSTWNDHADAKESPGLYSANTGRPPVSVVDYPCRAASVRMNMGSAHGLGAVLLFSREDRGAADLALTFSGPLMWLWLGRQGKGITE